nr:NusG domain II-containing protein [Asaccharospora irregularis]
MICLLVLGVLDLIPKETNKWYVVIKVEREIVKKIEISSRTQETYKFNFSNNVVEVEVKDGAVRMKEMNKIICPDSICSEAGWIKEYYEADVCMPNKIIVSFERIS